MAVWGNLGSRGLVGGKPLDKPDIWTPDKWPESHEKLAENRGHSSLGNRVHKNDDVGSILKFRSPSLLERILLGLPARGASGVDTEFCIGSVSLIRGLIAATLFADTISDPQRTISRKPFFGPFWLRTEKVFQ